MNCEEIRVLLAAYRRSEWTLEDQRATNKHLAGCADCRRWEASARHVGEQLRNLPTIMPPAGFKDRVFAAIREEEAAMAASVETMHPIISIASKQTSNVKQPVTRPVAIVRDGATQPAIATRERVGEVAIGTMRPPRVYFGRATAIATVAALLALMFVARMLPNLNVPIAPPSIVGCASNDICSVQVKSITNTNLTYTTVTSAVADGGEVVYAAKSSDGQEMLFSYNRDNKKTLQLTDLPIKANQQITVVALTTKLVVWQEGNPQDAHSDWKLYAKTLANGKTQPDAQQAAILLARNANYQFAIDSIPQTITNLWAVGTSIALVVNDESGQTSLIRTELNATGTSFTPTLLTIAAHDHTLTDPYIDGTTTYWVDVTLGTDGQPRHQVMSKTGQDAIIAVTPTTSDAQHPIANQQNVAWIASAPSSTPTSLVGGELERVLSIVASSGDVTKAQAITTTQPIIASSVLRGDGYFFWRDASGAYLYKPGYTGTKQISAIPAGALILGLSTNQLVWTVPAEHTDTNTGSTIYVLTLQS